MMCGSDQPIMKTIVFNLDGSTYNLFHNPASSCASQLLHTAKGVDSISNQPSIIDNDGSSDEGVVL
jgi:hypothetical protein